MARRVWHACLVLEEWSCVMIADYSVGSMLQAQIALLIVPKIRVK